MVPRVSCFGVPNLYHVELHYTLQNFRACNGLESSEYLDANTSISFPKTTAAVSETFRDQDSTACCMENFTRVLFCRGCQNCQNGLSSDNFCKCFGRRAGVERIKECGLKHIVLRFPIDILEQSPNFWQTHMTCLANLQYVAMRLL
jgi:hypothetical protein